MIKKIIAALRLFGAVFAGVNMFTEESEEDVSAVEDAVITERVDESVGDASAEYSGENEAEEEIPEAYMIENFPVVLQMPELPTGCEITAMTMVLNYYGFDGDKTEMAETYLPTVSSGLYYGNDGLLYGNDLNEYFIGDPFTENGYVCGTGAIVTAATHYLTDVGSVLQAEDKTGTDAEELYEIVSQDTPVVVWVTIGMADRAETEGWYTGEGNYVEWSTNDHGAVLVGYTDTTVVIADPLAGMTEYEREQFESVYESRGEKSVILM